ncbi:restriction endonuclease subunit S [Microcystis aeruginosa CS-1036]|uniref:restriction endonuclease subunit S n=1 Tax=Microcystis aeruginosa TaxID=1126 RepID=UPI00232F9D7F|nr:restriction endonuclease subunit S [Microcystis aeruginosa]MDB9543774.1 restriction endonuclease subunit S [Microcystis aeruginosa CS-1036]NCR98102.1 restriction endonuclease subunit S [Microcystis aeruginosa L311-01]
MSVEATNIKIKEIITIFKGKPPAVIPYYGKDALSYLSPEFLRGKELAVLAKPSSNGILVNDGDIVILWDGSNAGELFSARRGLLASTMALVEHSNNFDRQYFFYGLKRWESYLKGQTSGSGIPHVDKEVLGNLKILLLTRAEQTQIATILSTIDRAIEQTEALIAKQQRIKTGLMQDLLTKGIDENGNIRSEETHEFKDSPLGRIPVEWEVSQLRDTGTWLSGGTPSKSEKTYWGPFVPWVCSKDMKVFDLKNTLEMITQKGVLSGSKVAPKDSVLIVVRGMILAHTFPVVYLTRDMAFNQDIKAIIPNENIYGRYLAYWFSANSSQLLKLTTTATHGTKRLETNDLLEFALCLPSKMEQKKIIYLLDKSQYDIEITKEYLQKLKLQKTGLMQDLLTGKVRVTDLLNQKTATN